MIQDARRYVPALAAARHVGTIRETKVFPSDDDRTDGRPILIHRPIEMPGVTFIVGGKIDNIYDVLERLDRVGVGA
jgi:hypothetical protein